LAADAIPALVGALVDVAGRANPAHQLLHRRAMARLRRANEVVVRHVEPIPDGSELLLHPVAVLERTETLLAGAAIHVLRVLVVPHHEMGLGAAQPLIAR